MSDPTTPAGWYPSGEGMRYWDGARWTEHFQARTDTSPQPQASAERDKDPDAIWQAVGKPVTGIGAGRYKLTSHYLFFEKGTLRTDSQQVPIASVVDVDVRQSMTQKARGVGSVIVHIQRAHRIEIVNMEDIPNFREGQRAINDAAHAARHVIQRNQNTMRYEGTPMGHMPAHQPTGVASQPAQNAAPDYIEQLTKLGQLRDAGVLTEDEFQAKKADILSRM